MKDQYQKALENFKDKDRRARLVFNKLRQAGKKGDYYLISKQDVLAVNQAREAWLQLLSIARK